MAIYRPRRSPWPVAALALVIGIGVGLAAGYLAFANPEPDVDAAAEVVSARLTSARGLVEIAAIEYAEAVDDETIASEAEYQGARDALERASDDVAAVEEALTALAPERAAEIRDGLTRLAELMAEPAPTVEVEEVAATLGEALRSP